MPGEIDSQLRQGSAYQDLPLPTLGQRELSSVATATLQLYNKKLDARQLDLLVGNPGSRNLLWLKTACEELRVFGLAIRERKRRRRMTLTVSASAFFFFFFFFFCFALGIFRGSRTKLKPPS